MYIINNDTLFLKYDGIDSIISKSNEVLTFHGNVIKKVLEDSCIYYGSSFKGRVKGSQSLLESRYKLPVVISEKNNIIFFPINGKEKNYWFNFNAIKNYKRKNNSVLIEFNIGEFLEVDVSYAIFNNQMLKCSRLWMVYLSRC